MKKIVILGGGFGGVEFYKTLHKKLHGVPHVTFRMVSRWNYFLFYPMLHEVATGSVERGHITQPLREIVDCCVEQFTQAEIQHINFNTREVATTAGVIRYDYLVVSLGVQPNFFGIPGVDKHCVTFKSIEDAVTVRNHIIRHVEKATREHDEAQRRALLSFVIIGGGPAGVELAGQVADLLHHEIMQLYQEIDAHEISILLVEAGDRLLRQFHPELGEQAARRLTRMGVRMVLNSQVSACTEEGVALAGGEMLKAGLRVWCAGIKSNLRGIVDDEFLSTRGLLKTKNTLQMVNHPDVFVIGDNMEIIEPAAVMVPQTAQAAGATARCAARNLCAILRNAPLEPFKFKNKGDIVPIGDWYAVAEISGFRFFGRIAWAIRRFVFLRQIWSVVNRTKILIDWFIHIVLPRDTSEL